MPKISLSSNVIRKLFQNVFFINGTAYAGKSTMIKMLSEKYNGVCCGENYNEKLFYLMAPVHQPNLCYFQMMSDWQEFVNRSPDEYEAWKAGHVNRWLAESCLFSNVPYIGYPRSLNGISCVNKVLE